LTRLLNEAIKRRQAADALLSIADRVAEAGIPPMSMEEINTEVKAARAERGPAQGRCAVVASADLLRGGGGDRGGSGTAVQADLFGRGA
jgi:hypothetical protein